MELAYADGIASATDSMFCMELRTDSVEMYSVGEQIDANNKKWTALRSDNKVVTYEMGKVDKIPTSK